MSSNSTIRVCVQCLGRLVAGESHECQFALGHALAQQYPALTAVWDNPEDEAAFDVSDEAKAIILAPLEAELAEERAARASLEAALREIAAFGGQARMPHPTELIRIAGRALAGASTPAEREEQE